MIRVLFNGRITERQAAKARAQGFEIFVGPQQGGTQNVFLVKTRQ